MIQRGDSRPRLPLMIRRGAVLPLRAWLLLALLAIAGLPALVTVGASRLLDYQQARADQQRMAEVRRVVGANARRWHDPAWQRDATAALASLGADVRLVDASGAQLFITPGARKILGAATPWTAAHPTTDFLKLAIAVVGPPPNAKPASGHAKGSSSSQSAQSVTGQAKGSPSPRTEVVATAAIWLTGPPAGSPPAWAVPASAAISLLLVLALVGVFLGRAVLRPLAAMSAATEQIAGGDLHITLPSSRAREVAAVAAGLSAMSNALGEALGRQAAQEEERRLFVSAIAHDLRTPLFMLRGYLQGLENGVAATPEKIAAYTRACAERADTLERLIADLFDYSRLEYMDQTPRRERLDLGAVLRQAVEEALPAAAAKGVRLEAVGIGQGCTFAGDGALVGRAVRNLLDNALRHTLAGGVVRVCWEREGSLLRFAVADSGSGIAPDHLPHLFDPMYRAEASRNRHTGGAGLGLTIARRIMRAHGGDLTAANRAGGGAVFEASLNGIDDEAIYFAS
jgi:signal transduction histidine kinase